MHFHVDAFCTVCLYFWKLYHLKTETGLEWHHKNSHTTYEYSYINIVFEEKKDISWTTSDLLLEGIHNVLSKTMPIPSPVITTNSIINGHNIRRLIQFIASVFVIVNMKWLSKADNIACATLKIGQKYYFGSKYKHLPFQLLTRALVGGGVAP